MIPKIIHQIWIGPNKRPDCWMNTFKIDYIKMNPSWKYKLWNEENIAELFTNFPVIKQIYESEKTYNGKSDILRYLILYKHGGVYVDADSVWINKKSLDPLLLKASKSDFFVAFEPKMKLLCGGVMGSSINNNYVKKLIDIIIRMVKRDNSDKVYLVDYRRMRNINGAYKQIGPGLITRLYKNNKEITKFPPHYFYPNDWNSKKNSTNDHLKLNLSKESYMFQYGYTTNKLDKLIN